MSRKDVEQLSSKKTIIFIVLFFRGEEINLKEYYQTPYGDKDQTREIYSSKWNIEFVTKEYSTTRDFYGEGM